VWDDHREGRRSGLAGDRPPLRQRDQLAVGGREPGIRLLSRLMQALQGDDWYTELAAADVESACRAFADRLHVS
jgi:hypothetical protein